MAHALHKSSIDWIRQDWRSRGNVALIACAKLNVSGRTENTEYGGIMLSIILAFKEWIYQWQQIRLINARDWADYGGGYVIRKTPRCYY